VERIIGMGFSIFCGDRILHKIEGQPNLVYEFSVAESGHIYL
jgi:hypothetical protein